MDTILRLSRSPNRLSTFSALTFAAGVAGMAVSFYFLASAHHLDVIAGAAGFVAGSVLVAAGLVTFALRANASQEASAVSETPPMDFSRWHAHFQRNRQDRPEPAWNTPVTLPTAVVGPLVRSLEQFQLGDGGGPAYLIAHDRERFLADDRTRELVDFWFAEEREHSRLLGAAVARFGGHPIKGHWSFTAFCLTRKWLGVRFELTVLLLTEIASTVYYRLLRRHGQDGALRSMCRLIMRDEAGHIAFHRDRLARAGRAGHAHYGLLWETCFRVLGFVAASVLWVSHARALKGLGASDAEFYREMWRELSRFVRRLQRESMLSVESPSCGARWRGEAST